MNLRRQALHDAIEQSGAPATNLVKTSMLTGWVVVAEFMDQDGERWLARRTSEGITTWQREGYLHNALFADWDEGVEEDE